MSITKTIGGLICGLSLCGALANVAAADEAAKFYKGKTITLVIGFSPGGGADTFARFFQPFFAKHMPGKPNVIVQNMPGAGGIKAFNQVYNTGAQDGTRVILTSPSHTIAYLLGKKNVRYDLNKMRWIGTLTQDTSACVANKQSGIKSIEDAKNRTIIFGSTGKSSSTTQHVLILESLLGYKFKITHGYRGTGSVRLAMKKNEVEAVCSFWASQALGPQAQDIKSGELVPIVQMGKKKHPAFGNAPSAYDLAQNEEQRTIMKVVYGTTELSRPFGAPPGTPDANLDGLRRGFWSAVNDPALKARAKKSRIIIDPLNAADTERELKAILATPKALLAKTKKLVGG